MIEIWTFNQAESSGVARMSKLCGHSTGTPSVSRNASGRKSGAHSHHEIKHSEIASEATNTIHSVLHVCLLHIHMKLALHMLANTCSLTLALFLPGRQHILCGHS